MRKIIKAGSRVIVVLSGGQTLLSDGITDEQLEQIKTSTDEEILAMLLPEFKEVLEKKAEAEEIVEDIQTSNIITFKDGCAYWEEVSQLSMPAKLVSAVLNAEKNNDTIRLETYKNFWTLMSLNTDKECRDNLFWFLERNGLVISRCGFFVAYRNADTTDEVEDGQRIYTDHHSSTFRIKVGEMVTMPRSKCDSDSNVTCSSGLHLGASSWLEHNYYGDQGLVCLCNPADVVAVPHEDHYGKLRTCAYLPIELAEFDNEGKVVPFKAKDGFDCSYVTKVIYEGIMGTEQDSTYRIEIPEIPQIDRTTISNQLLDIAMKCITDRAV